MYVEDSFFTLSIVGRWGLVLISLLLGGATLALLWRLIRERSILLRLLLAGALFAIFVWLTPQVYYLYYLVLIDGLSWQIVVAGPPSPFDLMRQLLFQDRANLSYHSRGVLGWTLILLALVQPRLAQLLAR